jgi:hypothetical protein
MKRGRRPTGKALTGAERQARYRDRKHAELAALPDDPVTVGIPTLDVLLTMDDVMAVAGQLQNECLSEYEATVSEDDR